MDTGWAWLAHFIVKSLILNKLKGCDRFTEGNLISTELAARLLAISRHRLAITVPNLLFLCGLSSAGVAQLVEHLICNQRVGGSIPSASSTIFFLGSEAERFPAW